jgi:D-amino-acid dehydrogenase
LASRCRDLGVVIHENTSVTAFERNATRVTAVQTGVGQLAADKFVLAAGVWSGPLSKALGSPLPIRPGKGYSVDYTPAPVGLHTSLTFDEAHVAVTPLDGMIRVAGTMEFGGFENGLNLRRIEAVKQACVDGFEHWDAQAPHAEPWAGLRPMTPDGLPIIGALKEVPNVLVASGHGMLGLTLAPATGRGVRALVSGAEYHLDLRSVSPDRFARRVRRSPSRTS